jgi:monoamine oxidase
MPDDIIVIGAGACGLIAAKILSVAGKQVRVVEARPRAGGRILTIPPGKFSMHIEGGAEFIHGELPVTLRVLKEAGLSYHRTGGEMWNARNGDPHKEHEFFADYGLFIRKLEALKEDVSVSHFLESNFKGETLRNSRVYHWICRRI